MTAVNSQIPSNGGAVTAAESQPIRREEAQKHLPVTTLVLGLLSVITLAAGIYLLAGFNTIPTLSIGAACVFTSLVLVAWIACKVNRTARVAPSESQEAPAPSGTQEVAASPKPEEVASDEVLPQKEVTPDQTLPNSPPQREATPDQITPRSPQMELASLSLEEESEKVQPPPSAPPPSEPSSSQCSKRNSTDVDEEIRSTLETGKDPSDEALNYLASYPDKVAQYLSSLEDSKDLPFSKEIAAKLLKRFNAEVAKEHPDMIRGIALKIQEMNPEDQIGLISYPNILAGLINDGSFTNEQAILYLFGQMNKNQKILFLDKLDDIVKAKYKTEFLKIIGADVDLQNLLL